MWVWGFYQATTITCISVSSVYHKKYSKPIMCIMQSTFRHFCQLCKRSKQRPFGMYHSLFCIIIAPNTWNRTYWCHWMIVFSPPPSVVDTINSFDSFYLLLQSLSPNLRNWNNFTAITQSQCSTLNMQYWVWSHAFWIFLCGAVISSSPHAFVH